MQWSKFVLKFQLFTVKSPLWNTQIEANTNIIPTSLSLGCYSASSWPRPCSLKPFMLIKSNNFLQIQLAGEETLEAKLIPMDIRSVCETAKIHNYIQLKMSCSTPRIWCRGSSWLKWFTLLHTFSHQGHEIRHFISLTATLQLSLRLHN